MNTNTTKGTICAYTEKPELGGLLKDKMKNSIIGNNRTKFTPLQKTDFPSADAFTDYKDAVENLRVVLSNRGEGDVNTCAIALGRLGIDTAFASELHLIPKQFKGNRVDYSTDGGKRLKELSEIRERWENGEIRLPKLDKETGEPVLDKDGNPLTRKATKKECDDAIAEIAKEIKRIRDEEPIYYINIFFALSESAFRMQFEQVVGAYLAEVKIEDTEVKECFKRLDRRAKDLGLEIDVANYAMADDYAGCKAEFDRLKAEKEKAEEEKKVEKVLDGATSGEHEIK